MNYFARLLGTFLDEIEGGRAKLAEGVDKGRPYISKICSGGIPVGKNVAKSVIGWEGFTSEQKLRLSAAYLIDILDALNVDRTALTIRLRDPKTSAIVDVFHNPEMSDAVKEALALLAVEACQNPLFEQMLIAYAEPLQKRHLPRAAEDSEPYV